MLRRKFLRNAGVIALLSGIPIINLNGNNQMKKSSFKHVVYFWLNEPENQSHKKLLIQNLKEFIENMDNILDSFIGVPADTYREVVENTYQVSLNLTFADKEQHDIYQEHDLHKKFIDKSVHLWKKVLVYDSVSV